MTDEEFDEFVAEAHEAWDQKQDALTKSYKLGKWDEFAYDATSGVLEFKDKKGIVRVRASTVPLGSFSGKSDSWQWAWAQQSYPAEIKKKAEKLKQLFKVTGMDVFKMPMLEIDESMAWELVSMCVSHLQALGSYSMSGNAATKLRVFVAITEIENV